MFLGISFLAAKLQIQPDFTGRSTVVADIGRAVYGSGPLGHAAFALLQVATTLILVLAANTAYADFPRLANFPQGTSSCHGSSRRGDIASCSPTGSWHCRRPRSPW